MERTERLVRGFMASEDVEPALSSIVSSIAVGETTLLHIVKSLGDFLTAEDDSVRAKAVGFLSSVLTRCPPEKITGHSTHVLTTFYCEKLDDTDTIVPALKGLVPLTSNTSFSPDDAAMTIKKIFQHVTMKAHVQSTRFLVFTIVDHLLAQNREAMIALGDEFLRGYIELAEGEKDPRNLLLAFSIARVILLEFNISNHIDDFFNIIFCYFPISFRPPQDDPYLITPEDLQHSLRSCLNATPRFGNLAIPLFLEKLSAGSGSTKRDTLQTIGSSLPVYGVGVARSYASKMWSAFKLEIFQPIDSETAECALATTQTLIQVIYSLNNDEDSSNVPEGLGKHIVEECLEVLKEPEKSKAKPAIKVLAALVETTPMITRYVVSHAIPHLLRLFRDPAEISNRPATLNALESLIRAMRDAFTTKNKIDASRSYEFEKPLDQFKDELLGVLVVGLKSVNSASSALSGLNAMVGIPGLLANDELGFVVHNINEMITTNDESLNDVRPAALDVLLAVSSIAPSHVEETTLPILFGSLPETAPPLEAHIENLKYRRILSNLATLCVTPTLFERLVVRLSTKLEFICSSIPVSPTHLEVSAAYAHSVLHTLSNVLAAKADAGHIDIPKYLDRLVPRLYNLFIHAAVNGEQDDAIGGEARHPRVIRIAGKVIEQIVQSVSYERQETFSRSLFKAYLHGHIHTIADGPQKLPSDIVFKPFDPQASPTQRGLVCLFVAPVMAFHKEVRLPVEDEASFLSMLLRWSLDSAENESQALYVIWAVSSLVNKHSEALGEFLSVQCNTFWTQNIADSGVPIDKRRRAVRVWIWLTKALALRNHNLVGSYIDRLFTLFAKQSLSWDAAKAIGEIGGGVDKVLTKKNFAVLRVLSTQKYFNSVLPRILAGVESSQSLTQQIPYLVALASLIKVVPQTMYAHEMTRLMPLLLRGLELPDIEMRMSVIETLYTTSCDKTSTGEAIQTAASEHAPSLVTTMLRNSQFQEQSSNRLRKAALRYLGLLPQIVRYDILHPYKLQVIRDLSDCLDDPKRDVRKEAVDAREHWYAYSG